MCKHKSFGYINNGYISNINLFDDDLHLLESGTCILANSFIFRIIFFFADALTPSKRTFLTNDIVTHEISVSNQSSDL